MSQQPLPSRLPDGRLEQHVWDTQEAAGRENFSYYREAICKVFMDMTPEVPEHQPFHARVDSTSIGSGKLNHVEFHPHRVTRSSADIAASSETCFYLNLKLRGNCRISQRNRSVTLKAGHLGIFSSEYPFVLDHTGGASLKVASFLIPQDALAQRLPHGLNIQPTELSSDPALGYLLTETAKTISHRIAEFSQTEAETMFEMLVDLVGLVISRKSDCRSNQSTRQATGVLVKQMVEINADQPGLTVATVARACNISERYVHKLFEASGTSFSQHLMQTRLDRVALDLRKSKMNGKSIGEIAFAHGFQDLSHFSRSFRRRFSRTASEWRHENATSEYN